MKFTHFKYWALFAFLIAVFTVIGAQAQLSTASLSGTITDPAGSVVPNAKVTLTQTDTNFVREAKTKANGEFREEFLPVGPYKITVVASGFKTLDRGGIVLAVMQDATVNLALEIGGGSETVNVTADVPLVDLGDSTLGASVSNTQIENLPLINRDAYQLLQLTPGVQSVNGIASVGPVGFPEYHVYIQGSTDDFTGQVSYYLDGGLNMTGLRNSGNLNPNPDAISQFDVQTNNFSAQLGRYAAAVVSVVTKSGSNQFHGSAFEFYRTKNFNAAGHNSTTKTAYAQHRFGVTTGGPIRHDKDFFFGSYAGFRFSTVNTAVSSVPTLAEMTGDFSLNTPNQVGDPAINSANACAKAPTTLDNANFQYWVCNRATGFPYANNKFPTGGTRPDAGPGTGGVGTVTANLPLLDPTSQAILAYLASGSVTGTLANTGHLTQNGLPGVIQGDNIYTHREFDPAPQNNNEFLAKTDHQLGANHRVELSYFKIDSTFDVLPGGLTSSWSYSDYNAIQQNANASDTWTIGSRTVNQAWASYTRQYGGRIPVPATGSPLTWDQFGSDFGISGLPSRGSLSTGWFSLSQAITGPKAGTNQYGVRDVLNTTRGRHSLNVGGEAGLEKDFQQTSLDNWGAWSYATTAGARTNFAGSDFIEGYPNSFEQDTGEYANANYFNYAAFAQDDWHILHNLTINIGLRYDWQQAPTDTQNRETNFVPGVQSHAFGTVNINGKTGNQLAPIGMLFPGDPEVPKGGANTPANHISPRLGFSYDPFGKGRTVIHGAAGVFFGGISGNLWELPSNFAPYAVRPTFSNVSSMTHPYAYDAGEFPLATNPFPTLTFVAGTNTASFLALNQVSSMDPNLRWPFTYQMNFGIQQQVTNTVAFTVNYVGSLNRRLPVYIDLNPPQFNITAAGVSGASCADMTQACGYTNAPEVLPGSPNKVSTVNNRRPLNSKYGLSAANPVYSNVYNIQSVEGENYNGLQITGEKRMAHGFSVRGYFTWSKTLASTYLDGTSLNTTFLDYNYQGLEKKQRADTDREGMMSGSAVWKPDYFNSYNRLVRTALNGWTITAIFTANSGQPFTVTTGNDNYYDGQGNNRPSILPGMKARTLKSPSRKGEMNKWFDTSVYCATGTTVGTTACPGTGPLNLLGLERPDSLSVPGYRDIDSSILRDFQLYGRFKFELRGEATNVFNLTNLGGPSTSMTSSTFGQITGSGGSNRVLQVGGKMIF
jgi:hypothetical protein